MRPIKIITILIFSCISIVGVSNAAGHSVLLVKDGEPAAVLVLPEHSDADENLAARELQVHIERMSGAKLKIVRENVAGLSAALHSVQAGALTSVEISLTLNPDAEAEIRKRSNNPDAFLISITPRRITLSGLSPEGTLFAAYELLEQLGCRWYLPGELGTVIPQRKTVSLPEGKTLEFPSFPYRHLQTISRSLPWYRRQRLGGLYFPGSHGIRLLPKADFDKEPELFSLVDGKRTPQQLCVSNPEVVKRAIAATIDYFEKNPDAPWIGMGPNDGSGFCECENCRKLDAGEWDPYMAEPSVTDRYIWLFNRILDVVHQRFPGKKICFYAYSAYKLPPRKYKPNPCIVPALAPISLCRIHGMSNPICPDRSFYKKLMIEWGEIVPEVFERGYYFNLACPGFPFSKIHAVRDETVIAYKVGIKGWRVECMPAWASYGPTLYVAARLMWDVNTDVDALLVEFYDKFFGQAAQPMGEYLEMIDDAFKETDCHTGSSYCMPKVFTKERMIHGKALLERAASKAAGDGVLAQRVRIFRLSYDHLEAFLNMLDARNRFDFASAQRSLNRLREITQTMLDFRLYPSQPPKEKLGMKFNRRYDDEARLLWWRSARSYLKRFWSPCTESGYERTVVRGEFVAGAPDEWDFLIDPTDVGESVGWFRDGVIGGNWQRMRTKTASWSDQGIHYYKGLAWYRTRVDVPERFRGRKIYLWFGGVDEKAKVWLNGELLGESDKPGHGLQGARSAFKPFEFDATEFVRFGQPNYIAVKITNLKLNEIGTGGITAPVMFWSPKER